MKYSYSRIGGSERKCVSGPELGNGSEAGAGEASSEPEEDESGEDEVGGEGEPPLAAEEADELLAAVFNRQSRLAKG